MARDARRLRRGEHVQLREIPGLVGRVLADLYGCEPPMLQVGFNVYMGTPVVIEATRVERVVFDTATQDWRADRREGSAGAGG
jgi:hypothetical protein